MLCLDVSLYLSNRSHLFSAGQEVDGCQCGQRRSSGRIVGGEESLEREYPWMLSLSSPAGGVCGGSLIGDQWVLTAAHCTPPHLSPDQLSLHLGDHRPLAGHHLTVSRILLHPQYDPDTSNYDFSLLKLSARLQFEGWVRIQPSPAWLICLPGPGDISPVCLPENSREDYSGQVGLVTGWGVTQEGGIQLAPGLREVNVTVMSQEDCRSAINLQTAAAAAAVCLQIKLGRTREDKCSPGSDK